MPGQFLPQQGHNGNGDFRHLPQQHGSHHQQYLPGTNMPPTAKYSNHVNVPQDRNSGVPKTNVPQTYDGSMGLKPPSTNSSNNTKRSARVAEDNKVKKTIAGIQGTSYCIIHCFIFI